MVFLSAKADVNGLKVKVCFLRFELKNNKKKKKKEKNPKHINPLYGNQTRVSIIKKRRSFDLIKLYLILKSSLLTLDFSGRLSV